MNKKWLLVITLLGTFIAIAPIVNAISVFEVVNVTNVDGHIGFNIENDLNKVLNIDSNKTNNSVLEFYDSDDNLLRINTNLSVKKPISPNKVGLIVLEKTWPESNYDVITIKYNDGTDSIFPSEKAIVFANPAIEFSKPQFNKDPIYAGEDLKVTIPIIGGSDGIVSDIDIDIPKRIENYELSNSKFPRTLQKGERDSIVLDFERRNFGLDEGYIYQTEYVPLGVSYFYLGKFNTEVYNFSFVVFDRDGLDTYPPNLKMLLEVSPSEVNIGEEFTLNVFAYNDNQDTTSHDACNPVINATSESDFEFDPSSTWTTHSITFEPGGDIPDDPTTTFRIKTDNLDAGDHKINVKIDYKDCRWPYYNSVNDTITLTLTEPLELNNTTSNNNTNINENNSGTQNKSKDSIVDTTKLSDKTQDEKSEGGFSFLFLVTLLLFGVAVGGLVFWLLDYHSRYI